MLLIHTKTRTEYDILMDIYTKKWWTWVNWFKPHDHNVFDMDGENTIISYWNKFNHNYFMDEMRTVSFWKFLKLLELKPDQYFLKIIDWVFIDHIQWYDAYRAYKKLLKLCQKDALPPQ